MLKRGVEKVRDSLVTFSTQLNPNINTTKLEEDNVIFPTRWKSYSVAVKNGMDVTAWNRYKAWHEAVIAGDPKLNPTSTMTSLAAELDVGDSSKASDNRSHGRPKRKRTSTSLPPSLHKVKQVQKPCTRQFLK
jgi:hypothetical protein